MLKLVVSNSTPGVAHSSNPGLVVPLSAPASSNGYPTDAGSHTFGYNLSGNLATDTWTVDGKVFVKTFTWSAGRLTGESDWVRQ